MNQQQQNLADFIWNVADVLSGDFGQSEFGRNILPVTVLRRLECVLEPTFLIERRATLIPTIISGRIGQIVQQEAV